ncbi:hypothetical protein RclHR1_30740001 [Rhizophagus clarus]|uniref:Uncharacterized protein n=1 Tax=Rhizophagus clarus TaxID=94130 RepID=A0A2Z6S136_9GLOM|nr:hypothetical protein RclHR1_30740001 [Rhizophagus clarus]
MSDSSDNNDLFYGNKFSSSINSEDIHFAQELLGITVSSVEEQVERLVKSFGEAGHPLRFKALLQNTGIPNMLLSLIVNVGQRAIQTTIDKHSFLQQRFSSNFEEIMEEVTHVVISRETEKIGFSSTQS